MKINHNKFLNLAFNLAKINLGKTKLNPSVGCVVVKNNCVISSGYTSINGRPHAEHNALNKKIDFKGSDLYLTMEPCVHQGLTPPCVDIIKKKKISRVFYCFLDIDKRTANKSNIFLKKNKIKVFKLKNSKFNDFYQSYITNRLYDLPFIDAKIAISKDNYTINNKKKWITNFFSRNKAHLIRSNYDSIVSTSTSINLDNSLLNCRINGLDNNKPRLIIIDLKLKIKTNLRLFNLSKKRKILIITSVTKGKKFNLLKKKGVRFIKLNSLYQDDDFISFFRILKKLGCYRILIECGLKFLNELLKRKLIFNMYIFKSPIKLGRAGHNNSSISYIKHLNKSTEIKVNLNGDKLYKIRIK